jgi:ribosomal protein L33
MTYIAQVIINTTIQPIVEGDELAAFIGNQCRGVATIVSNDNKTYFYLLIYGNQNDTEKLSFKYYCMQKSRIFETIPIDTYFPNQTVGSLDTPFLFEF